MVGQTVSHYRITGQLGVGGMGEVFLAEDTQLHCQRALKFLPVTVKKDSSEHTRLVNEARALAVLEHPNICPVQEIGEHEGQTFIVMSYLEGRTLKERIAEGPLPLGEALDITRQISSGLAAAHAKGIVHRDIKPDNIMLVEGKNDTGGQMRAVLMDFGIAKNREATLATQTGTIMGTVAYMSPEQAHGIKVDAATDTWAVGVLLYEMLSGQRPFPGDSQPALLYAIVNVEPKPLTEGESEIPESVERVVGKALEKDPQRRYADAAELLEDLDRAAEGEAVKGRRLGEKTRGRLIGAIAGAVSLICVALFVWPGFLVFSGGDLGAVTETIAVEDEYGAVIERTVPKNEYRRRVLVYYPENRGPEEDAWASETAAYLLTLDMSQDVFLDLVLPLSMATSMRDAGSEDGHGLLRPKQRKLARDAHIGHFLTGTIQRQDRQWRLTTELHESESGKVVSQRTTEAADLFTLADLVSRQLREDLGIPAAHLEESPDLPIAEMASSDIQAVASHVRAMLLVSHSNDWEGALPHLEDAVQRDPQYALAQFDLFSVRQSLGDEDGSSTAIAAAMENLYRVPERLGFMIKAQYYYNEKQDAEKALAVINMWTRIYPDDVTAYQFQALFYFVRQDLPQAIAAYEKILAIDPSRVSFLEDLADLHTQLGNLDEAEGYLKRYVEIYPTRFDGYEDLSDFYSTTGRMTDARDALAQAQLLDPENLDLTLSLIDLDIKAGKYAESEKALADLLVTAETTRDSMRLYSRQVNLAYLKGRPDDLIGRLESFYDAYFKVQNPLQANLVYSMMLPAVSEVGRPQVALERLAEIKSLIPETYKNLAGVAEAWIYAELGMVPEATASLASATVIVEKLKFETYRSSLSLVQGMITEADGDLAGAIPSYRDAMETAIRVEPAFRIRLIRALRLAGKNNESWDLLQESLKSDPAHPKYMLELAHLKQAKGDLDQAQKDLAVALTAWAEAGPQFLPAKDARQLAVQLGMP